MTPTIRQSKRFMSKSFQNARYRWDIRPVLDLDPKYGVYVNIPFCHSFCGFCPFYKVRYQEELVGRYLVALIQEITSQPVPGPPAWIYFGGGTPNVLTLEQLARLVTTLKNHAGFPEAGIELMPGLLTESYLQGIKEMGFSKISLGVESFDPIVNQRVRRVKTEADQLNKMIGVARELSLFSNVDLMVGLKEQKPSVFLRDIKLLAQMRPEQITIYPFMVVRGFGVIPGMPEWDQFQMIETAWELLEPQGYQRMGPWTFHTVSGEYDCSKAELVSDFIGFGAGSFSTNKQWKVVNPPIDYYLDWMGKPGRKALIGEKSRNADGWRRLGYMLSDLEVKDQRDLPAGIRWYIRWLIGSGYVRHGRLTRKGMWLAHHLIKTIVEALPFPIQDTEKILNVSTYLQENKKIDWWAMEAQNAS